MLQRDMENESYKYFKPLAVREINDWDLDTRRETCQIVVREYPPLTSHRFVLLSDKSAIYSRNFSRNVGKSPPLQGN
jgi:hypothetical protein